ncbi:hypothetical protein P3X46_013366 [Hevea brasiliensis]|uniref:non-specific serine/threonine protein kinase n=1 Tax=Hevea brasiliensis TaxID=3981 RepID=A0ABQ9M6Y2_HEVBR|nr:probable LRR receptor-like serine/threonine-protein kinase At3g47570 [Hevea brasiliensis]KAJ9174760.1 hypothetical protein P3X46_013366 [Hevea brasiliensis]
MGSSCSTWSAYLPSFGLFAIIHFLCFSLPAFAIHKSNETDRLALLEFKARITNDPFGVFSSWNSSLHFCHWHGVICGRRHQRVTVLDLQSVKLSGSLSPHVGNLSFLRKLYLQNNSFSHEIPPQIGQLGRLQELYLHNNSFGGEIPSNISGCSNIVAIILEHNKLVGSFPVWLGSLLKLKTIFLGANNLTGTVPQSLGNLTSLTQLYAYENSLHGHLTNILGRLMNLRELSMCDNQLSGPIPPSIFNLSSIEALDLSGNYLQGDLPLSLGNSLPNIQFFSITSNTLTGSIPISISNASNLGSLFLSSNNLRGSVPSLEKLHRLSALSLSNNYLGSGNADDLKFLYDLINATTLQVIDIRRNNFGGQLPAHIGNFSRMLQMIDIENNQISGKIPTGIEFLVNLNGFYASSNKLSGTIPFSIGKLQNLQEIYLESNDLLEFIPSSIGNLTNLIIVSLSHNNLQGMIPFSLGNCEKLLALDLSTNNLSGPIPPKVVGLSSLAIGLDLSENRLSGSIPLEVGKLKNLGYLSLSHNMLSGVIPYTLGDCTSLELLCMNANHLEGSIPSSFSSLRAIKQLNLSQNNLSGKFPEFLKSFESIELLDLSYNNFEGMVPKEGIFRNASATLITGNKNLCGGIPDFGLPECTFKKLKNRLTGKLKTIISIVFALVAIALVLTCLFLYFSRKRKRESASGSYGNSLLKLSYQRLLKATNGFSLENLIGTGRFGSVYRGVLDQEGIIIAVKVLNLTSRGASRSFIAECEALRNIRHRNLVKVLTACSGIDYHGNDFKALVYDFMVNGSLDPWLHPTLGSDGVPRALNFLQRLNIAIDVASALEYLHLHCEMQIVHCDLKPSNVLLNEEMSGHLSDFGLVKFHSNSIVDCSTDQFSSIGVRGTIGYCPPEYGMGSKVSTFGDVFSFGILLLEMFTGKRPTDNMFKEGLSLHNFVKRALPEQVTKVIDPSIFQMQLNVAATSNHNHDLRSKRSNIFIECLISIFEIGISCSNESPQKRMNIGDVVVQLSSIKNKFVGTQLPRER